MTQFLSCFTTLKWSFCREELLCFICTYVTHFFVLCGTAGEKATFDCSIDSVPECNVTWLRNNRPLDDRFADRIQVISQGKTHKLLMMNCRTDDSGLYTALAVNPEGSTACSASLVVQEREYLYHL